MALERTDWSSLAWRLCANISDADADATVIVTAMLLFVATLNVAVVASTWRVATLDADHVATHMWTEAVSWVVYIAGVVSLATAVTRLATSPALGFLLLFGAAMTILTAAATLQRSKDQVPLHFKRHDALKKLRDVEQALERFRTGFGVYREVGSARSRTLGVAKLWSLSTLILAVCLMVTISALTDISLRELLSNDGLYALLLIFVTATLGLFPAGLITTMTPLVWEGWARQNRLWIRAARFARDGGCLLWLAFVALAYRDPEQLGHLIVAGELAVIPVIVPALILFVARRYGRGPGRHVLRLTMKSLMQDKKSAEEVIARIDRIDHGS